MKTMLMMMLVVCLGLTLPSRATISPEDKFIDREVIHQVANWLVQAVRNNEVALCNPSPHKRNSEIINSILGLPKNLNDAGRK